MTLVRDLIDIPEAVYSGDFVLRLSEGVERSKETLDEYVVTPELAKNFDEALGLIKSALVSRSSKAAYLHGSFGSGKSHMMAVLHMLLRHDPNARSKEGLGAVVANHTDWLDGGDTGKPLTFLLPTYHMIGAESLEAAVLGGYAEYVRRVHPGAPIPAVYKTEAVLQTVARTRELLEDERFFEELNKHATVGGEGGWGALAAAWTPEAYDLAAGGEVTDREHQRLIADVIAAFLPEFSSLARGDAAAFVGIDEGLAVMSQHAQSLGADAVVLFLDELILWLMTRLGDQQFVAEEASKVAKLVEAESANRPIPIVSFVARQRDLRELAGQDIPGAEQLALLDTLNWWQGRFALIELQDTNLPAIAEQRVLRPKSDTARMEIDAAFSNVLESLPQPVLDALLAEDSDRVLFRQTYPFTPAFIKTLVAASSVLQRERTALKVMVQLLVNRRDDLTIEEIIPVGDLYDILAEGDEPFSAEMQRHFTAARTLYERKLRPTLLREHNIGEDEAETNGPFRADDRLVKTLLLAALVPDVQPLRVLDARRLTALNHGQVRALFAGQELGLVVNKLRTWAAAVGEIRLSDDSTNPTVTVQLTGIDVDALIARADAADTEGERRRLVKGMLLTELGVDPRTQDELIMAHRFVWRGSERSVELAFDNIRDRERLPDATMRSQSGGWKLIVDLPFDDETHRPTDDRARVQDFLDNNEATKTLCWLPNFLSRDLQRDLGTLVKLEYLLTGERFDQHADQLSPVERPQARMLLENQRSALRERIRVALAQAYAATTATPGIIDPVLEVSEHFQSLEPGLEPRPPVGPTLDKALEGLLGQVMEYEYPEHPKFESTGALKIAALRTVQEEAARAIASPDGRIEVETPNRRVLSGIAQPLNLGTMHETAFVLEHFWKDHFDQQHAAAGEDTLTVGALRGYLDLPKRRGLDRNVQNLVILTYAAQTNQSFSLHGGAYASAALDHLPDELELREQKLPADATWSEARDRASRLFGLAPSPLATGTSVAMLVSDLKAHATAAREPAKLLVSGLADRLSVLGIGEESSARHVAASAAADLVEGINGAAEDGVIDALVEAVLVPTIEAVAASISRAETVANELATIQWPVIDAAIGLELDEAKSLRARLATLLQQDEHSSPIGSQLQSIQAAASDLLRRQAPTPGPAPPTVRPPGPTPPPPPPPGKTYTQVDANRLERVEPASAKEELERIEAELSKSADVRLTIDWTIEHEEPA